MSKKVALPPPPPQYRDEPSASSDAISLHTNPEHYHDDALGLEETPNVPAKAPPTYTDAVGVVRGPSELSVPAIGMPVKMVGNVQVITNASLDSNPEFLEETVRRLARAPPQQLVRISGHHYQTKTTREANGGSSSRREKVEDFNVTLDLTRYLMTDDAQSNSKHVDFRTVANGVKTYRGTVLKKRMPGHDPANVEAPPSQPELREWCHRYCAKSGLKIFRFSRKVENMDTHKLESQLKQLVYDANYRGHVSVTFPVEHQYADIYSDTKINRWRTLSWLRFLCYITLLFIFIWPYLFFSTKRYEVVEAIWPFAIVDPETNVKRYVTISEDEWLATWRAAISEAILSKQKRMLLPEDLERVGEAPAQFQSGNENLDGVVNFISAGIRGAREVSRQLTWGYDC